MLSKNKKIKFIRKDYHKKLKLGKKRKKLRKWRRPVGTDNKVRLKKRGHIKKPSIGYSKPKEIRGKIDGFFPVLVRNIKEIENLKENEIPIISSSLGLKKKIEIVKKALELKKKIVNIKNLENFLVEITKKIEERKKRKIKKLEKEKQKESEEKEIKDEKNKEKRSKNIKK